MGVGASISLAMAAVLLQSAVLVRTGLTLRALLRRLGFGTRRLLRALGPSTGMALAAGLLAAAAAWASRTHELPLLLTLTASLVFLACWCRSLGLSPSTRWGRDKAGFDIADAYRFVKLAMRACAHHWYNQDFKRNHLGFRDLNPQNWLSLV